MVCCGAKEDRRRREMEGGEEECMGKMCKGWVQEELATIGESEEGREERGERMEFAPGKEAPGEFWDGVGRFSTPRIEIRFRTDCASSADSASYSTAASALIGSLLTKVRAFGTLCTLLGNPLVPCPSLDIQTRLGSSIRSHVCLLP
ncbi:uncharacterized protein BDW43DRAFT_116097 [Aspergillus alliaceus]|uniref:uncharacterized protein n=1 Tax=Petromyces alliaceus TaxID=209559 RepID=UPI0012A3CF4A|nr:uncharacterized protein BDW43DRAFT_116097 [Aspergillus alliaceus]KAB8238411.1 hypothetical protein BDW43DRAFT_116097 [Aspergillus alliaceus]